MVSGFSLYDTAREMYFRLAADSGRLGGQGGIASSAPLLNLQGRLVKKYFSALRRSRTGRRKRAALPSLPSYKDFW